MFLVPQSSQISKLLSFLAYRRTNAAEKPIAVTITATAVATTTKKPVRPLPLLPQVIHIATLATQTWHQSIFHLKVLKFLKIFTLKFSRFRNWDGAPPRYQSSHAVAHPIPGHAATSEYERPPPYNFAGPYPVAPSETD